MKKITIMSFNEWILRETGMTWDELKGTAPTQEQRYRLYSDYDDFVLKEKGMKL